MKPLEPVRNLAARPRRGGKTPTTKRRNLGFRKMKIQKAKLFFRGNKLHLRVCKLNKYYL